MNAIDLVKLSGAIPVKTVDAAAKTKTEGSGEAGAFMKLLSSVSTEESGNPEQQTAGLLAEIESAVAELQQLPPEELQPEQQELIASLVYLLAIYQQHTNEKPQDKNLIRINFEPPQLMQASALSAVLKADTPIQEKLVQLVQQIAQKVQKLNDVTTKEFADVPIFIGGKKEYILSSPNKINDVLALLLATTEKLEKMPEPLRIATAAKLENSAQELLKLFSGKIEEIELPKDQKQASPLPLFIQKTLEQFTGIKSMVTTGKPGEPSSAGTVPLLEAAINDQPVPEPANKSLETTEVEQTSPELGVKSETLKSEQTRLMPNATILESTMNDQPAPEPANKSLETTEVEQTSPELGVKSETLKSEQTRLISNATIIESTMNDQATPLTTTNPLDATKAAPVTARQETPIAPAPVVRLTNLADDLNGVISSSFKLTGTGETAQLKVSIFPEHLGHLDIRLSTVDGKITAQILTSTPMAKEALELQVYQLRNSLVQQGIQVERIEITTQQQAGQTLSQQQGQQEQRFARQQKQQSSSKNGYQQTGEESSGIVRSGASRDDVMAVDYTI